MSSVNRNISEDIGNNDENLPSKLNDDRTEFKESDNSTLTYKEIQEIMSSDGEIVKAVLLKTNGKSIEIDYNTTPRLNEVSKIIDGSPTIIGSWEELEVVLVKNRECNGDFNLHKLRWPFSKHEIKGDILCYRIDENGNAVNFSLNEYLKFAEKIDEDLNRPLPVYDNDNEDEDENVNENIHDDQMFEMTENIDEILSGVVYRQFTAMHNRDPTEEEMQNLLFEIKAQYFGVEFNDDDDADDDYYVPENDDEDDDEVNDSTSSVIQSTEDINIEDDIPENLWKSEYEEALDHIRSLGAFERQRIMNEARSKIIELQKTDDTVDVDMLTEAFDLLRDQLISNDDCDNDDENDVEIIADENIINNENDDDNNAEEKTDENIESIQSEIREAFDHVRKIGNRDGRLLANRLCETFYETNGREPDAIELHNIFSRLKETLKFEAADEVFDHVNERVDDNDDNVNDNNDVTVNVNDDKQIEEKIQYHENNFTISAELKDKAINNFLSLTGREPTSTELNNILFSIEIDDDDENDDDYEPTAEEISNEDLIENELLLEHESTCDKNDVLDSDDNIIINLNEYSIPETIERDVFVDACNKLKSVTNHSVTEIEINNIIEHLQQINLEDHLIGFENNIIDANGNNDHDSDSDYVPNEDELNESESDEEFENNDRNECENIIENDSDHASHNNNNNNIRNENNIA